MNRHALAVLLAVLLTVPGCVAIVDQSGSEGGSGNTIEDDRRAILAVLEDQAEAWNRGDLEAFMDGYWESSDLTFTSGGRIQRGWQTTFDRYRATYGNAPSTMGRLAFYDVEIHPMGDAAWVMGRWALDRSPQDLEGVFTLVFRHIRGEWVIVHDHTSSSSP